MRNSRPLCASAIAALAVAGLAASGARTTTRPSAYRIVFGSSCHGEQRAYSLRPDGSGLTPLLPRTASLEPRDISGDGKTVAYTTEDGISVSRADGTGLRRLAGYFGGPVVLSRDGGLLAFSRRNGIWILRTNGRGLRRVTSGKDDSVYDWSPDAKALVFIRAAGATKWPIVVQPLRGRPHVLVRDGGASPAWSPDGRWIAYLEHEDKPRWNGLWIVRPSGAQRHRIARDAWALAWSADGKSLAFTDLRGRLAVVGVDGRGLRRLSLGGEHASSPTWLPDERLAFVGSVGEESAQITVARSRGRGLRRLTSACKNELVGWTRLTPVLQPVQKSERILAADMLATRDPIVELSADGSRVAIVAQPSPADCEHLAVWAHASNAIVRLGPRVLCRFSGEMYDLAFAGSRTAWAEIEGCGNFCDVALESATLALPTPLSLSLDYGAINAGSGEGGDYHLHGDGDLLVFNDLSASRLVRIGTGHEKCQERGESKAAICATLRRGAHVAPVQSVNGGLIAVRERDAVAVVDTQGKLVRLFPFAAGEVDGARLDGGRLAVARAGVLEVYDAATGEGELQRPLPTGYELVDADGGIVALQDNDTIVLLRLADGHSLRLAPGRGPRIADLEPPGLFYSYVAADGGGRVVFVPRSEIVRQLG